MSLAEKLSAAMAECRYMPLDKENTFQKYKYTSAAAMFAKINEALTKQGLYVQSALNLLEMRDVQTSRGNVEKHAIVEAKLTISDGTEEPAEFVGLGSGQDAGDKAIMKANTAALKYAYIGGLCIAMADDPEADGQSNQQPALPAAQNKPAAQNVTYRALSSEPAYQNDQQEMACTDCGQVITQKVYDYSTKKYGRALCYNCQHKPAEEDIPFD